MKKQLLHWQYQDRPWRQENSTDTLWSLTWKKTMQLLLFGIIQLHCSPRAKNAQSFATMAPVSAFPWLTVGKHQHGVKAAEISPVPWACSPHTAKTCLLWAVCYVISGYLKDTFFLFWLLETKTTAVPFSNCFFLWSQIAGGNPVTVMPLCLHIVRADLWDFGIRQIHEAGNFKINLMLGIIYKFTRIDVHLQSQGYLPHFPRVQQHPPSAVLKKSWMYLAMSVQR